MRARGIALIMGLLLLAAISLLALMAVNGMVMERRMSANFGESYKALAQATRAAAAARAWLYSRPDIERESGCVTGCLLPAAIHRAGQLPRNPEFESASWWQSIAVAAGSHPETGEPLDAGAAEPYPPRWIMEELRYMPLADAATDSTLAGVGYYRIFARGNGGSPGRVAVTEAIVARPWDGEFEPLPYPVAGPTTAFCRQFDPPLPCGMQAWRQRR